jgi:hypothetical protein
MVAEPIVCTPKALPRKQWLEAADRARQINPVNYPPVERMAGLMRGFSPTPMRIAVMTTKYWGPAGVRLTVGFLDNPPSDLRRRVLLHMNAWANTANVTFTESRAEPKVRIARSGGRDGGYWSYVGTDILGIAKGDPTMNLEGFTMKTPESEFVRVVRHEAGHTLGFPHEHMRRQLVNRIDRKKAIAYFRRTQGWSAQDVAQQVLTPLEEGSIIGTPDTDEISIMCYQLPGIITKNGKPILGGEDISAQDAAFVRHIYPRATGKLAKKPRTATKRKTKKKKPGTGTKKPTRTSRK